MHPYKILDVPIRTTNARLLLKFAALDATGDVASLLSVIFQPRLSIMGLPSYLRLGVYQWMGLKVFVIYFRTPRTF